MRLVSYASWLHRFIGDDVVVKDIQRNYGVIYFPGGSGTMSQESGTLLSHDRRVSSIPGIRDGVLVNAALRREYSLTSRAERDARVCEQALETKVCASSDGWFAVVHYSEN